MPRVKQVKTCNRCGEGNLYWRSFEGSWRLSTPDGKLHDCPMVRKRRASAPDNDPIVLSAPDAPVQSDPLRHLSHPSHPLDDYPDGPPPNAPANAPSAEDTAESDSMDTSSSLQDIAEQASKEAKAAKANAQAMAQQTPEGSALWKLVKPHAEASTADTVASAMKAIATATDDAIHAAMTQTLEVATDNARNLIAAAIKEAQHTPPAPPTIEVTLPNVEVKVRIEGAHKQTADLIRYLGLNLPTFLVGPPGSGKTHASEHAAQALGLRFYPQSVGAQTSKTDLLGYIDAHGRTVRTVLREAFEHGGVYLLDEVDAGNANVLTILNAALANDYCSFPDGVIRKHADFRCVAAGNTYGLGANRQFVGRQQLDAATLDRFVTIDWDYDLAIEAALGLPDWAGYVQALRNAAAEAGIRQIFSTRAIIYGSRMLRAGIDRTTVEQVCLWARVPADDRAKLEALVTKRQVRRAA